MGWSLGANNSANIFGTGVGSGLVRYRTAILLTAACVILGAVVEGSKCIVTLSELSQLSPVTSFLAILSAALTMTILTFYAIPASSSQAVVGALMGVALFQGEADFSGFFKIVVCWVATPLAGWMFAVILYKALKALLADRVKSFTVLNRLYFWGIIITGCYCAYAFGANNVANVTGPYVAADLLTPRQAVIIGGASIALGVLTYSRKTMMTVGKGIVPLEPFAALVSILSEALVLHLFTQMGVPVPASLAVVGTVIGVGMAKDHRTLNLKILTKIMIGWICNPIFTGCMAWLFVAGQEIYITKSYQDIIKYLIKLLEIHIVDIDPESWY